jgi:hypothetical protein
MTRYDPPTDAERIDSETDSDRDVFSLHWYMGDGPPVPLLDAADRADLDDEGDDRARGERR